MDGIEYVKGYESKTAPRTLTGLPNIGELSYGCAAPYHRDGRSRSDKQYKYVYPWSAIVSLLIETSTGNDIGTGFFIGPKTVATCGHCVLYPPAG